MPDIEVENGAEDDDDDLEEEEDADESVGWVQYRILKFFIANWTK